MLDSLVVVVPCYNEESRLRPDGFAELVRGGKNRILFVDDGSTDGTFEALQRISHQLRFASVLRLEENRGKAEAVRRGLLQALEWPASFVGYLDADLATPAPEMVRVVDALRGSEAQVAMGCRLRLRGAAIARNVRRRFLGQSFSLAASAVLGARFRDTQCGAKAFRVSRALHAALEQPFHARWAFDVELLGRLLTGMHASLALSQEDFLEVPLQSWHEVPGSKLRPLDVPLLGLELMRIAWELLKLRIEVRDAAPLPLPEVVEDLEEVSPARVVGAG